MYYRVYLEIYHEEPLECIVKDVKEYYTHHISKIKHLQGNVVKILQIQKGAFTGPSIAFPDYCCTPLPGPHELLKDIL